MDMATAKWTRIWDTPIPYTKKFTLLVPLGTLAHGSRLASSHSPMWPEPGGPHTQWTATWDGHSGLSSALLKPELHWFHGWAEGHRTQETQACEYMEIKLSNTPHPPPLASENAFFLGAGIPRTTLPLATGRGELCFL